jgi:hypothetical protein
VEQTQLLQANTLQKFQSSGNTPAVLDLTITKLLLHRTLQKLFPGQDVIMKYKHQDLQHATQNKKLEYDIFIPSLSLAFEYQGEGHYQQNLVFRSLDRRRLNDEHKRQVSASNGITLINIPFWWNKKDTSLAATIRQHRLDLLSSLETSSPIPVSRTPHLQVFKGSYCYHEYILEILYQCSGRSHGLPFQLKFFSL